jgi:hypothetical protein
MSPALSCLGAGCWVLGSAPRRYIVISDRDPDWSRARQACPVREGYISAGRGFVGHGIRAEAHLIEWSRGEAHLIEPTSGKEGKEGKDVRRVASSSINVQRVLSSSSFSTLLHLPAVCACPSPRDPHSHLPRPTPPNITRPHPYVPSSLSRLTRPIHPNASHPVSDPVPSSYLLPFSSLAPLAARPRHTGTDTNTDIRQRQRMARGTAHDAAARRKTWRQGRHGTRVDVDVSGARSGCGR